MSFPNLLQSFVEEYLFSLANAVGTTIHLDQAMIKRTRPSCARVKVLVDLKGSSPKYAIMNIEDEVTREVKVYRCGYYM